VPAGKEWVMGLVGFINAALDGRKRDEVADEEVGNHKAEEGEDLGAAFD